MLRGAPPERAVRGREAPHGAVTERRGDGGVEPREVRRLDADELRDGVVARVAVRQVPDVHLCAPSAVGRGDGEREGRRTRTGQLAVKSCMAGEERKRAVRERSVGTRSPVGAMSATLSCTRCGNCALNAAAMPPPWRDRGQSGAGMWRGAITHHGYAGDVGARPADVLHEEGELGRVEPAVVRCLGRVGVAAAVEICGVR